MHLEEAFLDILETAPSNHPEIRDGKALWLREVHPAVTDLERVLAHFAINQIFRKDPARLVGYSYSVANLDASVQETGHAHFAVGAAEVVSIVTLERTRAIYAVVHFGGLDVQFFWMPHEACADLQGAERLNWPVRLPERVPGRPVSSDCWRIFKGPNTSATGPLPGRTANDRRGDILKDRVEDYLVLFEQLFDQDHALLRTAWPP